MQTLQKKAREKSHREPNTQQIQKARNTHKADQERRDEVKMQEAQNPTRGVGKHKALCPSKKDTRTGAEKQIKT